MKSVHHPNEVVAFKRGSPLLVGIVERETGAPLTRTFQVREFQTQSEAMHKVRRAVAVGPRHIT